MEHNIEKNTSSQFSLIQTNVPLKDKSWFKTGGPAAYFAQPTTPSELQETLIFARDNKLELFILGQGANILISDEGFNGLVIRPQLANISIDKLNDAHILVTAGAGVTMDALIEFCLDHNILGLEEFSGIPGTVGGSVYINLHYYEFLLSQFLVNAQIINRISGTITTVDNAWFNFGYDQSSLQDKQHLLVNATFKLKKASTLETAYARGRRTEIIRHRTARYPNKNTCGSFFRNFHEDEVKLTINDKKMIFVAYYLDKIGVKGQLSVGGARVSHQHANMIVTDESTTSTHVIQLARTMQQLVYDNFGIIPQPECQLIGFNQWPLL